MKLARSIPTKHAHKLQKEYMPCAHPQMKHTLKHSTQVAVYSAISYLRRDRVGGLTGCHHTSALAHIWNHRVIKHSRACPKLQPGVRLSNSCFGWKQRRIDVDAVLCHADKRENPQLWQQQCCHGGHVCNQHFGRNHECRLFTLLVNLRQWSVEDAGRRWSWGIH